MKMIALLIVSFLCNVGLSKDNVTDLDHCHSQPYIDQPTGLLVYENPDDDTVYAGGNSRLLLDIAVLLSNINAECDPIKITRINLSFIVPVDGKVVGARIKGKPLDKLNSFELHAIKSVERDLSGKWTPGKVNGVNINQLMYYPINIHLQ